MYLYNMVGIIVVMLYNLFIISGSIWLIVEKDWSPWTLLVTTLFLIRWKEWDPNNKPVEEKEESKIIV